MASPGDWYKSLPPVCKFWGTACVLTTVGIQLAVLDVRALYLDYPMVFKKFQIWRLLTNFCFLGGFSFPFVIRVMMIARYGVFLEQHTFEGRTADFVWMVMLGMLTLLPLPLIIPSLELPFLSASLVFMLVYLWSRENPNANTSIMGMIQLKAFYLPWGMMAMTALMGGSVLPDFIGIVAGHLYYFLTVLQPRAGGPTLIYTPSWVQALCFHAFGVRQAAYAAPQAPRTFGGGGRRLGAD
mmetsp:Transcript_35092/g.86047  ORF Transcript_35092/g.86047 Transcript_35092/m.86047 type:complete len:240 (+) Transcript_35092:138-857(+)